MSINRNDALLPLSPAVATTFTWTNSAGEIVESDTVLWQNAYSFFTGTSGCSGTSGVYLEDVATHEFGH
jgi:hypothetical protein